MKRPAGPALLLLAPLLASCAGPALVHVSSLSDVRKHEVIIVGRVRLTPPLEADEQEVKGIVVGKARYRNKIFILTSYAWKPLEEEPSGSDYRDRIEAVLERTFTVVSTPGPFYIRGATILVADGAGTAGNVYLPGGLQFTMHRDDRAVYIGTIHYRRDEFWHVGKPEVEDDYADAASQFHRTFGADVPLRKELARPVR